MIGGRGMGIGGAVIALILSLVFGVNIFDGGGGSGPVQTSPGSVDQPVASTPQEEERMQFMSFVLDDVQQTWTTLLPKVGEQYQEARMAVFRDGVSTACGDAPAAVGPFYCPADQRVYLDLSFFDDLERKLGAPGDFAQAYVLAHELGHHVQNLTGTLESAPFAGNANERSVRVELQADCYAGVWGHEAAKSGRHAAGQVELDPGDVEEGLNAAAAIGDDRLQKRSQGRVAPESFTHGSSEQRVSWFRRGMETGDPRSCDTFADGR